jgi:hypothetical protein
VSEPPYWFHAKRYGWGWGLPASWHGWVALGAYVGVVLAPLMLGDDRSVALSIGALIVATPVFTWICHRKGEPTEWRWGRGG